MLPCTLLVINLPFSRILNALFSAVRQILNHHIILSDPAGPGYNIIMSNWGLKRPLCGMRPDSKDSRADESQGDDHRWCCCTQLPGESWCQKPLVTLWANYGGWEGDLGSKLYLTQRSECLREETQLVNLKIKFLICLLNKSMLLHDR